MTHSQLPKFGMSNDKMTVNGELERKNQI